MARCNSCSAPLPTQNPHCRYCGVRNDLDLHAAAIEFSERSTHPWRCPDCAVDLEPISVDLGARVEMERCGSCFGMFFAPGGVEHALKEGVSHAHQVKLSQIDQVNEDRFTQRVVRYRSCPVCEGPMRRYNFGRRSGVIVDQCNEHGIWLDNGELIHLLEWRKSGGHLLDELQPRVDRDPAFAARTERGRVLADKTLNRHRRDPSVLTWDVDDLVHGAVDLLTGLFK